MTTQYNEEKDEIIIKCSQKEFAYLIIKTVMAEVGNIKAFQLMVEHIKAYKKAGAEEALQIYLTELVKNHKSLKNSLAFTYLKSVLKSDEDTEDFGSTSKPRF